MSYYEGPQPGEILGPLEPEVEDLLLYLVERSQTVPRPERRFLMRRTSSTTGAVTVFGGGVDNYEVAEQDLDTLVRHGYLIREPNRDGFDFYISASGRAAARDIRASGDQLERIEEHVLSYIRSDAFRHRHPRAHATWRHAAQLLVEDPIGSATRIGHDCREAMMAFASSLVAHHGVTVEASPTQTVSKVRAVLDHHRSKLSEKTHAFCDALIAYCGDRERPRAATGARRCKEGEALDAEDARRLVWQTALVMYELDRALVRG